MLEDMSVADAFRLGYCVGVYEGEGTINLWRVGPNRTYAKLVVRMTDEDPVKVLQSVFGGHTKGPYLSPGEAAKGYKPKYRWTVSQVDEVLRIIALMRPFLSRRRQAQLDAAIATVEPNMRRAIVAGNQREGRPTAMRPRKTGGLVCPERPEPSARGYQRHRLLGIPVCEVCRASFRLYYNERNRWKREAFKTLPAGEQERLRVAQRGYVRAYRLRQLGRSVQVDS